MNYFDIIAQLRSAFAPRPGHSPVINLSSGLDNPHFEADFIAGAIDSADKRLQAIATPGVKADPLSPLETFALQVLMRAAGVNETADLSIEEQRKARADAALGAKARARIEAAWCRKTAMRPETWSEDNPAKDQCAVTAALIYELTGLPIVRGFAYLPDGSKDSHYWNEGVDLTFKQFPEGTVTRTRAGVQGDEAYLYLMSNPELTSRLYILKARFEAA